MAERLLQPYEVAAYCYKHWQNIDRLCDAVRVVYGEAFAGAYLLENGKWVLKPGGIPMVDANMVYTNADGSRDRGMWQINDKTHATITDAVAFDPVQSTAFAFKLWSAKSDFSPWSAFKNGTYQNFWEPAINGVSQNWRIRKGRPVDYGVL